MGSGHHAARELVWAASFTYRLQGEPAKVVSVQGMVRLDGSAEWERTGEVHLEWPCLDQPIQVLHQLCVVHGVVTRQSHVGSHIRFRHPVGISDSPAIAHRPERPLGRITTRGDERGIQAVGSELARGNPHIARVSFNDRVSPQSLSQGHAVLA